MISSLKIKLGSRVVSIKSGFYNKNEFSEAERGKYLEMDALIEMF
jgi:hypothetical protein